LTKNGESAILAAIAVLNRVRLEGRRGFPDEYSGGIKGQRLGGKLTGPGFLDSFFSSKVSKNAGRKIKKE
jgi:hypothetical protein